jgi:hypothetical protein
VNNTRRDQDVNGGMREKRKNLPRLAKGRPKRAAIEGVATGGPGSEWMGLYNSDYQRVSRRGQGKTARARRGAGKRFGKGRWRRVQGLAPLATNCHPFGVQEASGGLS